MPRIRRTFKRAPVRKRKGGRKLNPRQKQEVKRIVGALSETKFWDASAGYAQVDRGATIVNLFTPARGTGSNDRVGDETKYKMLDLRITAYYNGNAVAQVNHVLRVIIFKWQDDSAVNVPVIGDILQNTNVYLPVVSAYAYIAGKEQYYSILSDRSYSIGEGSSLLTYHLKKMLKGKMEFGGNVTTGKGSIYMMLVADDATGAHVPDLQVQYYSRITFTDA